MRLLIAVAALLAACSTSVPAPNFDAPPALAAVAPCIAAGTCGSNDPAHVVLGYPVALRPGMTSEFAFVVGEGTWELSSDNGAFAPARAGAGFFVLAYAAKDIPSGSDTIRLVVRAGAGPPRTETFVVRIGRDLQPEVIHAPLVDDEGHDCDPDEPLPRIPSTPASLAGVVPYVPAASGRHPRVLPCPGNPLPSPWTSAATSAPSAGSSRSSSLSPS